MKINKININFPHAIKPFTVYSDNVDFIQLLKMYYGSLVDEFNYTGTVVLGYINETFFVKDGYVNKNAIKQNPNTALCNAIMYIRNHVELENDWFLYHGACSVINGKTYLFIGHSGSGKTTLTTFLHYQPKVVTVSEDICIVNYKDFKIESVQRPFLLRPKSYDLLATHYKLDINKSLLCNYNVNEKVVANINAITPNITYAIDEIVFLNLCNKKFEKFFCNNINNLLENSYNHIDIYKGVCSATMLLKKIPAYSMYYYDLLEMYEHIVSEDNRYA